MVFSSFVHILGVLTLPIGDDPVAASTHCLELVSSGRAVKPETAHDTVLAGVSGLSVPADPGEQTLCTPQALDSTHHLIMVMDKTTGRRSRGSEGLRGSFLDSRHTASPLKMRKGTRSCYECKRKIHGNQ